MPFSALVGHRHLLTLLARAVSRESQPPSLLFAGPAGVGKFSTAAALAEAINCTSPLRGEAAGAFPMDACGQCPSCVHIRRAMVRRADGAASALDALVVLAPDEKGSIKVDPTRAVIERTAFRPLDGRRRLVIVDEADALEVGAQNALLKVLEEPPSATAFVLVSARPDALLSTIRSRCPRLRFGLLEAVDVERALVRDHGADPVDARRFAALSGGSLGRALTLMGGQAHDVREVALAALVAAARGRSPSEKLAAARTLVTRADDGGAKKKGSDNVSRLALAERVEAVGALLRDVQVVSCGADERWLASADLATDVAALADVYDQYQLGRAFAAVDRARAALERNASPKVVADWLALQL